MIIKMNCVKNFNANPVGVCDEENEDVKLKAKEKKNWTEMKKVIERIQSSISMIVLEDMIMMEIVMTIPLSGFDSLLLMCVQRKKL